MGLKPHPVAYGLRRKEPKLAFSSAIAVHASYVPNPLTGLCCGTCYEPLSDSGEVRVFCRLACHRMCECWGVFCIICGIPPQSRLHLGCDRGHP